MFLQEKYYYKWCMFVINNNNIRYLNAYLFGLRWLLLFYMFNKNIIIFLSK